MRTKCEGCGDFTYCNEDGFCPFCIEEGENSEEEELALRRLADSATNLTDYFLGIIETLHLARREISFDAWDKFLTHIYKVYEK